MNQGYRSEGGDGLFIIHHSYPEAIIEINFSTIITPYIFISAEETRKYLQLEVKFISNEVTSTPNNAIVESKKKRLCDLAWQWYCQYQEFETEVIHFEENIQKN